MVISRFAKIAFISLLFFFSTTAFLSAQNTEDAALQKADSLQDNAQKIEAFKNFLNQFPASHKKVDVLLNIFTAYVDESKADSALVYADQALISVPEPYNMNIYNDAAYYLAVKKVMLDSADVYSKKAVELARGNNPRYLGTFLDTRALVMYDLGKADSAVNIEKEAISVYRDDPSFISSLATYQNAAGSKMDALKSAAKAVLLGNTDEALTNFNDWISKEKANKKEREKLRKEIAELTLKEYFKKNNDDNKNKSNSSAAVFLAFMNVNLKQADKWITESMHSLTDKSPVNDRILFIKNSGIVLFAEGKYNEAIKQFISIKDITDLWDSDYWYTLGRAYEKVNNDKEALDSYITGNVFIKYKNLESAIQRLGSKLGYSEAELKSISEKKRNEQSDFEPGKYNGKKSNNVLLAEIFTGAECPPCAAADYALEDISDYFSRNEVAILEYHLHIPAPDPLTNPDTWGRYVYYGRNFGTPMVIIQGNSQLGGGGPKYLTKNRFNIYKYTLEKYLFNKTSVKLNGNAALHNDYVIVNLHIDKLMPLDKDTHINIALVEKSINYPGGNGVTNQLYVVRHLLNSNGGSTINTSKGADEFSGTFDLKVIEKDLSKYLDDPTKDPSWRRNTPFAGWIQRNDKLNRGNLAVVAWLQNNKTKDVLQTVYIDVPQDKK